MHPLDKINTWEQGHFIDQPQYSHMSTEWKQQCELDERLRVRPSTLGNAVCVASDPGNAIWIAQRLNKLSYLESRTPQLNIPDRGKFEKWARDKGHGKGIFEFRRSSHCYHDGRLEDLWRAWQYAVENN